MYFKNEKKWSDLMTKGKDYSGMRASLEELERLGSPVDLAVADIAGEKQPLKSSQLEIEQVGDQSHVFEFKNGAAGYMAYVRITNQTRNAVYPLRVELRDLLGESLADWLVPSIVPIRYRDTPDSSRLMYRFPQMRELDYDEVLNHILLNRQKLIPKRPYEGWLVGTGEPRPSDLRGQVHDLILTITASDHTEYSKTIPFWVERYAHRRKPVTAQPIPPGGSSGTTLTTGLSQIEPPPTMAGPRESLSLYR
jgi:hypothetical protein